MDVSGSISELTEVFEEADEEDSLPYRGGTRSPEELVGGSSFRRSTVNSGISWDCMDDEVVFPPPPPPRGEPIHSSSLVVPQMQTSLMTESSSTSHQRHQRHSLPSNHLGESNRRNSPNAHHFGSASQRYGPLNPISLSHRQISAVDEVSNTAAFHSLLSQDEEDNGSDSSLTGISSPAIRQRMSIAGGHITADLFSKMKPPSMRPGERSLSTTVRLRRQGFKMSRSGRVNFAVKSIRRGSDEWHNLIKPFVADLAFRSLEYRRSYSEVSFRPYTCQAAVLFVDLSNYSGITAAIADRGPHELSGVVNAYLGRILDIVRSHGGDPIKFAGDAVLVVWEGQVEDLQINCWAAAKCALELQKWAGVHPIEGTDLTFRIHCGLCCGQLESEIFAAPVHVHMQRLYHSVGGESLVEISELADVAKAGETCISNTCLGYLWPHASHKTVIGPDKCSYNLLTGLDMNEEESETVENFVEQSMSERMIRRNKKIEEDFIHPSVIRLLSHGGLSPTQIAQMRSLCVLFIAMTSNGSSVNWLMEVQAILDKNRCPIVQIIDDDKGVHVVAAVNLYESIPETSLKGVEVCCELVSKQVGCAIGVAQGATFCGVTGSSSVACRWDITGPPAVRAARLMQFALRSDIEVAVDQSVYDDPAAGTRLKLHLAGIELKGCRNPISVYTISTTKRYAALRVLETVHGRCHDGVVKEITRHIAEGRKRCAVLVNGISLAGKKIVCQRAAGFADLVPYLHVSDDSAGFLQLARTMATWFQYIENDDVRYLAESVLCHLDHGRWSRAHDECIELVNTSLDVGLRSCFLVDRVQFLDDFSVSLIRECLHGRSKIRRTSSQYSEGGTTGELDSSEKSAASAAAFETGPGIICFLLVHVNLYNWKSASHIVADITRSHKSLHIPIITLGEADREELRLLFRDLADMETDERWLDAYAEASGFCAGYFIERVAGIRNLNGEQWLNGHRGYTQVTPALEMYIPPGLVRITKAVPVRRISAEVAMRFSQVFDGLPPLFQTFAKILSLSSRTYFFELPRTVMWETLNDLITTGVEVGLLTVVINEMEDMSLIKIVREGGEERLAFRSPALADVAFEVCTPVQIESIGQALIDRLEPLLQSSFKVPLAVANLYHLLGEDKDQQKELFLLAFESFLQESRHWDEAKIEKWKEIIDDEIRAAGYDSTEIFGEDFLLACSERPVVSPCMPRLKMYGPPLALGPMAHTFSVICRNTFHEHGAFHGYAEKRVQESREAVASASKRYLLELEVVEAFLNAHGIQADPAILHREQEMIIEVATPSSTDADVRAKAEKLLDVFIPEFIDGRLKRLYALVEKLRVGEIPTVVKEADAALFRAYRAFRTTTCRSDAAQDALMILAVHNWKPTPVPEYLPLLSYQTVARIRNKVLKRLTEAELFLFRHQQTAIDLEAFLIITPLLLDAQKQHKC